MALICDKWQGSRSLKKLIQQLKYVTHSRMICTVCPFIEYSKTPTIILDVPRVKHAVEWWLLDFMLVVTPRQGERAIASGRHIKVLSCSYLDLNQILLILILVKQGNSHKCSLYYSLVYLFTSFLKKQPPDLFAGTIRSILINQQDLPPDHLL